MTKKKKSKNFSRFLNNPIDFTLIIVILLLLGFGLTMVLSASSPSALAEYADSYAFFKRQLVFAILGLIFMAIFSKLDYRFFKKFYKVVYWISLVLLVLVKVAGKTVNGAQRWLGAGSFSFQPSELVKFLIIIFYAGWLVKDRDELPFFWKGFCKHFIPVIIIVVLLLLEPHLSASIVIAGIVCIMMLVAGMKFKHLFISGIGLGIPALALLIAKEPYRLKRFVTFLDPWQDMTGDGWQVVQSLYAIGSGGLFGAGLGNSKQKYLYIPEPHNDFIFSILAEELGFVGCAFVLILFGIFIWRGILIAMKAPDMFGSLIAVGITSQVAIQVILNIAVVTSSIPATGVPLPFFSYGGTALFFLLCEMGVLLNISRAGATNK